MNHLYVVAKRTAPARQKVIDSRADEAVFLPQGLSLEERDNLHDPGADRGAETTNHAAILEGNLHGLSPLAFKANCFPQAVHAAVLATAEQPKRPWFVTRGSLRYSNGGSHNFL